jgi:galactokinase
MIEFQQRFGRSPDVSADAPGRVNLIGEHTDYNGGFVLPTAIPQRSRVELALRSDRTVRMFTTACEDNGQVQQYDLGTEARGRGWLDYVQGVTWLLRSEGHELTGFDGRIDSDVPPGSGLSSSAALTVSLMRALRKAFGLSLADVPMALLGQRVENEFVGARVGVMDPMAAGLADDGTALFLDARSLEYERLPLSPGAGLIVIHSGVSHRLSGGDYNTRRRECERAADRLGVKQLRDLTAADLPRIMELPDPLGRRTRHVVTENDRVLAAVAALRAGNCQSLGELFCASHQSMRDDYEVSIPEIDLLVELAAQEQEICGARLTGGGFGGSVVMLARAGFERGIARRIAAKYAAHSRQQPKVLVPNDLT